MKSIPLYIRCLLVAVTVSVLSACGGGEDYTPLPPAFEVGVLVAGQPVVGVDVQPGYQQTINLAIGQSFELDSTAPVAWAITVGGSSVPLTGGTIYYDTATIQELVKTSTKLAASTAAYGPLSTPMRVTVKATSLMDPSQVATIDLVFSN